MIEQRKRKRVKNKKINVIVFFGVFSGGSAGKESTCKVGNLGSIPGWEDSLEEGMETHLGILAWKIPWTEKPDRPLSMGLQRIDTIEFSLVEDSLHQQLVPVLLFWEEAIQFCSQFLEKLIKLLNLRSSNRMNFQGHKKLM